jgi:hypothetical protein
MRVQMYKFIRTEVAVLPWLGRYMTRGVFKGREHDARFAGFYALGIIGVRNGSKHTGATDRRTYAWMLCSLPEVGKRTEHDFKSCG